MSQNVRDKLQREVLSVNWQSLIPHLERGALLAVIPPLNLVDAAYAFVEDDVSQIKIWLSEQKINKINKENCDTYSNMAGDVFQFLIIQPFVLFQKAEATLH